MGRTFRWLARHGDAVLAIAFALAFEIEVAAASYVDRRPLTAIAVVVATLPLALRRRHPLAVFLAVFAGMALVSWASPDFDENSGAYLVLFVLNLYSFGANARGWQAWSAAALVPGAIAYFVMHDGDAFHPGDVAFGVFVIAGPWAAGVAMRLRRTRERSLTQRTIELELERETKAREAVAAERARIARELHDVVAHAISVVVVQARGGRKVLATSPDAASEAFDAIERVGEQALGEMRRLLGMLREDDPATPRTPQPSVANLASLVDDTRASGLPVEVSVVGEPIELAPGIDLAAYRITQEALTNALKHAGPSIAHVRVGYGVDALEIAVTDDGIGNGHGGGTGNGLVGLRERVAVVGGELTAGPLPGGGFAVRALLPYGDTS